MINKKFNRLALCASFLVLGGQAPSPISDAAPGDFCSRLAANSGIDKPAAPDGRTSWTASPLNFGNFLFGGSAATVVEVKPIEPATIEDYKRLEDMCQPGKNNAVCNLAGPGLFRFGWKGRMSETPIAAGERATVIVEGSKTTCRWEAPLAESARLSESP